MQSMTLEEFQSAIKAQGVPLEHVAFRCPMCGTVQSATDLIVAGAGKTFEQVERFLGFSCVGRWRDCGTPPGEPGRGCNWTLGGFLKCHALEVVTPDGKRHPRFALCTPEEAQEHHAACLSTETCQLTHDT
jgi:hypothetical protein